jgi:hypothetical protein
MTYKESIKESQLLFKIISIWQREKKTECVVFKLIFEIVKKLTHGLVYLKDIRHGKDKISLLTNKVLS